MRQALYILGQLNDSDVLWLARNGSVRRLADGEVIVHEGRAINALFITLRGQFRVILDDGREVSRMGAGEVVGEIAFVDSSPPTATVASVGEAVVLALSKSVLQGHLSTDDGFAARFYRALAISLANRLRAATRRLELAEGREAAGEDELDAEVLDTVAIAGQRFTRLVQAVAGR